ncbi:chromosome segregation protein SMC [Salmonella enterica subsp. arizonae serovar 40:z36:-]|nr:chromosome segregation protein SMC [Salmonella enterica]EBH9978697.1 chromosome segregation protein SMC [Salmonella enterica subsp. arizonae serovar 40:z36:-]
MRLDSITIGSPKNSPTHRFKNLKNVVINFDQDHWITVIIGWNGTGKSNVLEALAIIFRDFIQGKRKPAFAFKLEYKITTDKEDLHIKIDADPDRKRDSLIIHSISVVNPAHCKDGDVIDGHEKTQEEKKVPLKTFLDPEFGLLPRYVFAYYSGESDRLYQVFRPYLEDFDKKLRSGDDPGLKRLFYAMPVHSQFVLLAFLIQQSEDVRNFLTEHLGLDPDEGIESVLFVLREPPWVSNDGDPRFWKAKGVVASFLDRLYSISLAPIEINRRERVSLWNDKTLQFKYLYIKDIVSLRKLVGDQRPAEFFRDMESTHVSQLIDEVRIRVRLRKNDGTVTFRELSEGEQQLLTVLGLLRFTAESESLFLLDEPDTHLNPRWAVDYFSYLKTFAGYEDEHSDNSHILLTTHNPLAIAELVKEQVQILQMEKDVSHSQIIAVHPELDPRGLGYAAIVTSDMFGIASSLDQPTHLLLERQRAYAGKQHLTQEELMVLSDINTKLERLGFRFFHPDEEYSRYLRLRSMVIRDKFVTDDPEEQANRSVIMTVGEREELGQRLIRELLDEQDNEEKD